MIIVFLFWHGVATIYIIVDHTCPHPSVEQVQRTINTMPAAEALGEIEVDGIPGKITTERWMMHSPAWEAQNERKR